jgi:hypothetical protein
MTDINESFQLKGEPFPGIPVGDESFSDATLGGEPFPGVPVEEFEAPSQQEVQLPVTKRRGRASGVRVAQQLEGEQLLSQVESGQITSQDLTPEQIESVRRARVAQIPELAAGGLGLSDQPLGKRLTAAAAAVTTLDPDELGQILEAQFPGVIGVATTPEGQKIAVNNQTGAAVTLNRPGISTTDIIQGLGLAATFTPAARLAAAAPGAVGRAIGGTVASPAGLSAITGAAGAGLTEAAIQEAQERAGGEFDAEEVALAAGLGAGAELIAPAARAVGRAVRPTTETTEQAARRRLFESEGLTPTRPQLTREATEFQTQQELAKAGGPVRARLEQQEVGLQGAFERKASETTGRTVTSTSTPIDEVLSRSVDLDARITQLYSQARAAAPKSKDIKLNSLASNLRRFAGEEQVSGGLISSIRSNLKNRGVINKAGKVVGRISVETAEQIRQDISGLFDSVSDRGRQLSRKFKNSLDDDVFSQTGEDIFEEARSAKAEFESDLRRAKLSKFDSRKSNLVRDMLENKINEDTFIQDVVFAKSRRPEDIDSLKIYLNQTESGKQAWNDIRAQTINEIRERAFKGPVREDGVTKSLSRAELAKTLDKLGKKKNVLFTAEERQFLDRMKEIAKFREPPPATFIGRGPSAQAIDQLKNRIPLIGPLIDSLSASKQARLMLRLPKRARRRGQGPAVRLPTQLAQTARTEEV